MTIEARKKLAAHIQRILKVRSVSFLIANTDKGPLTFKYIKDAPDFEIVLDAVPLNMNDYDNRELKSLLEKYLFEKEELTLEDAFMGRPIQTPVTAEEKQTIEALNLMEVPVDSTSIDAAILIPEKKKSNRSAKSK